MTLKRPAVKQFNLTLLCGVVFLFCVMAPRMLQGAPKDRIASQMVSLKLAIKDLMDQYGSQYPAGSDYLKRLAELERLANENGKKAIDTFYTLQREALLTNPLLDFEQVLVVQRKLGGQNIGLPQNWQGNCALPRNGYDDGVVRLNLKDGTLQDVFRPLQPSFVGDVDLHWDGDRFLFSMLDSNQRWQVWEYELTSRQLRPVTTSVKGDYDNYDGCYLPDNRMVFASTRVFQGVPCVGGGNWVANLFLCQNDGSGIRRLCFDQDHNWCPSVMPDGRILYTRWEYSDTSHYFTRLLMAMNPDGTNQMSYYGSNSYWPNSLFYARSIPGSSTKFVGIVSGHHGVARMGELHLFDTARGQFEADGVIQQIPGYGKKVQAKIEDQLVNGSWPKFLHPWPLSEKYFLVAMQPDARSLWGIYLVDIFDNMVLLKELDGYALFEPVPLTRRPVPSVIPDRIDPQLKEAKVYLTDVYFGPGLYGVPRGTIKNLRIFAFHYAYPQMGGHKNIAVEGTWDVHRILGTVPVETDGSAFFQVPANTPLAVQPLDEKGRAVQVMRSWFTAMPGETISCIGCHERSNSVPPSRETIAARRQPDTIKEWYGPARGFSFKREVQPVLDKYCVGCHDGSDPELPDLARKDKNGWGNFTPSYLELHRWVRRPGPESDYHLEQPMEYHASTSELVQMLEKGHHGVSLDREAWDRLFTWIDLNVPDHGSWKEHHRIASNFEQRRLETDCQYSGYSDDMEDESTGYGPQVAYVEPEEPDWPEDITLPGWPVMNDQAQKMQQQAARDIRKTVDLGEGIKLELALIPAGTMIMGSTNGYRDELPRKVVVIEQPFWMAVYETTNEQFKRFDPDHFNGYVNQQHKDHTTPGYPMGDPQFPVVRVSQQHAMDYCRWLSEKTGLKFSLPSEKQWEWACRAGTDTEYSYGNDAAHATYANLADHSIQLLAVTGVNPSPIANPNRYEDWLPKIDAIDDGQKIICAVGQYQPESLGGVRYARKYLGVDKQPILGG